MSGHMIKVYNKLVFVGLSHGAHRIQNFLQENERKQTDPTRGIHFDFDWFFPWFKLDLIHTLLDNLISLAVNSGEKYSIRRGRLMEHSFWSYPIRVNVWLEYQQKILVLFLFTLELPVPPLKCKKFSVILIVFQTCCILRIFLVQEIRTGVKQKV